MKHTIPIALLVLSIYVYSCANQGTPTGGVKDTIPPVLLKSFPKNETINFKDSKFTFVFDEKIDISQLKKKILITPHTENKFNFTIKKNTLIIKFEEVFEDSTTYTFNFSGGLADITEKNQVINLSLAFSTGTYIDSIYINGKVLDLMSNKPSKEYLIALYKVKDTLDVFKDKPRYFTKTNQKGVFTIENIKNGYYKLIAYEDLNKNLTLDLDSEPHGFIADSVDLNVSQDSIKIKTQFINAKRLKFIRAKKTGRYFDLLFNKPVLKSSLKKLDTAKSQEIPLNNAIKDNKTLRFYHNAQFKYDTDSLGIVVMATDSMGNSTQDTVYIQFSESKRKTEKFTYSVSPKNNSFIDSKVEYNIMFSKPITLFSNKIEIHYDTIKTVGITDSSMVWNNNRTAVSFETLVDKNYLKIKVDTLLKQYADTSIKDTVYQSKRKYYSKVSTNQVKLVLPANTFISLENDSTEKIMNTYKFKSEEEYGSVSGSINSTKKSFIIQIVDSKYQVIDESKNASTFHFPLVKPGKYTFRVLIDSDKDGRWSRGNILQNRVAEEVYFYEEFFDVRANWELEKIEISF